MGYLDNTTITVDAILTKKGRQILASGQQNFNITKFALSDDEVDYHLWNPAHPSGSNYYGVAIEQLPVLEPTSDETQIMRFKLVSLDKSTTKLPVITVIPTSISFFPTQFTDITPQTSWVSSQQGQTQTTAPTTLNSTLGYTAILHNSDVATLSAISFPNGLGTAGPASPNVVPTFTQAQPGEGAFLGDTDAAKSVFVVGMSFRLSAKQISGVAQRDISTTLTIIGNETGGSVSIPVTLKYLKPIAITA